MIWSSDVYTFGRTITLNTDHKPLESIFQKPISLAPSPAELLFNRWTNTRLAPVPQPSILDDEQKHKLAQKRSSHLKKGKVTENYVPNQPIWFTEDGTTE